MIKGLLHKLSGSKQSLGIEVTDTHVKICEAAWYAKNRLRIQQFACMELPTGAVEGGKVNDWTSLGETIKNIGASTKFGTKVVHFAVPIQMVMVRSIKLPDIGYSELRKLVQFEITHNFSLSFEDPYYDFVKLPRSNIKDDNGAGEKRPLCDVLVVAAPSQLLRQYRDLFESLGLIPASFEIAPFALQRLAENSGKAEQNVQMLVHVNERLSEMTIMSEGSIKITRHVEVDFKSTMDQEKDSQNDWLTSFASPEQTFLNGVQDLVAELERFINFYNYTLNNGQLALDQIWLTGGLPEMAKLQEQMTVSMSRHIQFIEWPSLEIAETLKSGWNLQAYAVALGLSMKGKRK